MADIAVLSKFVFGGTLALTESWSCSLHITSADMPSFDAAAVTTALTSWFTGQNNRINKSATLDWWKWNAINQSNGKYLDPQHAYTALLPSTAPGSTASAYTTPQLTVALSLRTDVGRGRMSKGRIYLPTSLSANDIGPDGRLVDTSTHSQNGVNLIRLINTAAAPGKVIVWSQLAHGGEVVTKVSAGKVVDTQQRRRKNLVEEYAWVTV